MSIKPIAVAFATAGLISPSVMAQSNVTVYGVVDAYLGYGKMGDNRKTGVGSGGRTGSRLGFKGSEDLGNNLKAVFVLEYWIAVDENQGIGTSDSNSSTRARQQFVGLQGSFGFVGLGRQYAPGYYVMKYDAAEGAPWGPQSNLGGKAGATILVATPARWNNSVNYKSANMGGVTVNTIYSFGEEKQDTNRRQGDRWGIGAEYANGPVGVNVIYHHGNDVPAIAGLGDKKEWYVGGSYNFGAVKLLGSFQQVKQTSDTNKIYQIGAIAPVSSAGRVHLAVGQLEHDRSDMDATNVTVGYTHALSKRTTGYVYFVNVNNKSRQNATFFASGVGQAGDNSENVMVGVNHTF